MRAQPIYVFVVLIFVPNVASVRRSAESWKGVGLKCCGVYEQFDSSGKCVPAPWSPADVDVVTGDQRVVLATDVSWVSRWFPPGPPRNELVRNKGTVFHSLLNISEMKSPYFNFNWDFPVYVNFKDYSLRTSVNQSSFYRDTEGLHNWTRNMVLHEGYLVRQKPGSQVRDAYYCVDAVKDKTAPYLLVFRTLTTEKDGLIKCCKLGDVIVNKRPGHLDCDTDHRGWRNPTNTSFSYEFDLETPFDVVSTMIKPVQDFMLTNTHFHTSPLPPDDVQHVDYTRSDGVSFLSSAWVFPCVDLKRGERGDLSLVFGYFLYARRTGVAFMISRNLPYVSTLILFAALVAICCKERLRSSAHGWGLCCHAGCLLLFNIGQIVFNLTMNDVIEKEIMAGDRGPLCMLFGFPMYLLLLGANGWMVAISYNMFYGFKRTGGARAGEGQRKRFGMMCTISTYVVAVFSAVFAGGILITGVVNEYDIDKPIQPWYNPTFAETRTCYSEVGHFLSPFTDNRLLRKTQKWGTALYYYVPTLAMVAANCVFLWLTGRRVRYLRRGNSVLKRAEREGGGRKTGTGAVAGAGKRDEGSAEEFNVVVVYIKLLLAGGGVEFLAELITWIVSSYDPLKQLPSEATNLHHMSPVWKVNALLYADHSYAHRTVGFWADLFRALVVLLVLVVAPDLRAVWRRLRGKGGDSPAQGAAPRPAPRPTTRPAARRGQQESAV